MTDYANRLKEVGKNADFWAINIQEEQSEELAVRKNLLQPLTNSHEKGALITVIKNDSVAYAATQDLSTNGINQAFLKALAWAETFSQHSLTKGLKPVFHDFQDKLSFFDNETTISKIALKEKIDLLFSLDKELASSSFIVDTEASFCSMQITTRYLNSQGADLEQSFNKIMPCLTAIANDGNLTQVRTLGGMRAYCQHGGWESIKAINLPQKAQGIAKDAVDLLKAQNCPNEQMDLLIDPDQMMLQIHESIGHPLELDRILGDERNYAGTSFVNMDMFGKYQYGSSLLNITFDPTIKKQFASYGYDDEGTKAQKDFIIKDGLLVKPLGGSFSQARANMEGVANARFSSWNRPPIDRMANLNLEPGSSSFEEMLASVERGLYVKSNSSWSIDDSRNKFQFGCEWGQLIENGKLTKLVRNPNYRGISSTFWRNLKMVGNQDTFKIYGTPYCGKGEPNQVVKVGHASPVCLFSQVEVFGGEQ